MQVNKVMKMSICWPSFKGAGTTSRKHGALRVVERCVWGYGGASSVMC